MIAEINSKAGVRHSPGKYFTFASQRVFIATLALVLATAGAFLFYDQRAKLLGGLHRSLTAIALQKANRLSTWFAERQGDAASLGLDPLFGEGVARWLTPGGAYIAAPDAIQARLESLMTAYGYQSVILYDGQGNQRLALGAGAALNPNGIASVMSILDKGLMGTFDLHEFHGRNQPMLLDFFVPVRAPGNPRLKPVAVVLLRLGSDSFIVPLLEERPVESLSTESLLVRRENDKVVILTEVHKSMAAGPALRFPLNQPEMPAAMAARGIEGIVEGTDYAGHHVIAALRAVPGPDWKLVLKIDKDEAYAPIRSLALTLSSMMLFVFAAASWMVGLWSRSLATREALRNAESALDRQALVQHFEYLSKNANDLIILFDAAFCIVEVNDRVTEAFQRTREELIGSPYQLMRPPGSINDNENLQLLLATSDSALYETVNCRKDGSTFPVEVSVRRFEIEGKVFYQGIARDITGRKQAEASLLERNRLGRLRAEAISTLASSRALLDGNVEDFVRQLTEQAAVVTGVERANVWFFNDDESELRSIDVYEATPGRHSTAMVLRQEQYQNEFNALKSSPYVNADHPLTDPRTSGYVETYIKPLHITSMLDVVIDLAGRHVGLLCLEHVDRAHHWEDDEIAFARQLSDKIALALVNRERGHAAERLLRNLRDTVTAIAITVEMRDPFTAGHHVRVAELAAAIGVELGLAPDQVEGIRLGASIFDIGKISIPAEVLNRPGPLRGREYDLVKTHAQVGHDIVGNINFPWPVAKMILHHHERIDGSGYPEGLKGDAIPLEARILAVADVVEAMCSHRPHRPAPGINAALVEISANKGILYDTPVAEACVRLFREKGFEFSKQ